MAPGFCALKAFTTWNTSTTPSVLHLSMVVVAAQNMAERLTVLLYIEHTGAIHRMWLYLVTYMPCTTTALLPVLLWTLETLSMTVTSVFLSAHL